MPESFKFSLKDANIKQPSRGSALPWKIAVAILIAVVGIQSYLLIAKGKPSSAGSTASIPELGKDTEVAAVTHKAREFISSYLTFSATQLDDQKARMIAMMTRDYANAYQIVWQDPTLTAAIKERKVQVSVEEDLPSIKGIDEEGRIFVNVSGKVIVRSDLTYIHSQERLFSGTVVFVKTPEGLRVANVIWRNAN